MDSLPSAVRTFRAVEAEGLGAPRPDVGGGSSGMCIERGPLHYQSRLLDCTLHGFNTYYGESDSCRGRSFDTSLTFENEHTQRAPWLGLQPKAVQPQELSHNTRHTHTAPIQGTRYQAGHVPVSTGARQYQSGLPQELSHNIHHTHTAPLQGTQCQAGQVPVSTGTGQYQSGRPQELSHNVQLTQTTPRQGLRYQSGQPQQSHYNARQLPPYDVERNAGATQRPHPEVHGHPSWTPDMSDQSHRGRLSHMTFWDHEDDYKPGENIENQMDLRREILHELRNPRSTFDGSRPEQFEKWRSRMSSSLRTIGCGADFCLTLLERNASGGALDIINDVQDSGLSAADGLAEVWRRLRKRFGDTTLVAESLSQAVVGRDRFPDYSRQHKDYENNVLEMEQFLWLCKRLQAGMEVHQDLVYFNSRMGLQQIAAKMPTEFEEEWEKLVHNLRRRPKPGESCRNPTLNDLVTLIDDYVSRKSNSYFMPSSLANPTMRCFGTQLQTEGRDPTSNSDESLIPQGPSVAPAAALSSSSTLQDAIASKPYCFQHCDYCHNLEECPDYIHWDAEERLNFVSKRGLCFRCLDQHVKKYCKSSYRCTDCGGSHHQTLHGTSRFTPKGPCQRVTSYHMRTPEHSKSASHSYNKTLPVLIRVKSNPCKTIRAYCFVDEQSSNTLCHPDLLSALDVPSEAAPYTAETVMGTWKIKKGRKATGLEVSGVSSDHWISLPDTLTCSHLPRKKGIATSAAVSGYPELAQYADQFPDGVEDMPLWLLIGNDCGEAMVTQVYGSTFPQAHRGILGWSLVGPAGTRQPSGDTPVVEASTQSTPCDEWQGVLNILASSASHCESPTPSTSHCSHSQTLANPSNAESREIKRDVRISPASVLEKCFSTTALTNSDHTSSPIIQSQGTTTGIQPLMSIKFSQNPSPFIGWRPGWWTKPLLYHSTAYRINKLWAVNAYHGPRWESQSFRFPPKWSRAPPARTKGTA